MDEFFEYFKGNFFIKIILFLYALFVSWFANAQTTEVKVYETANIILQEEIIKTNIIYFNTYKYCNLKKQENMVTSNAKNIFNDVKCSLIKEYPIHNDCTVKTGYHQFYNNQEHVARPVPAKFIII